MQQGNSPAALKRRLRNLAIWWGGKNGGRKGGRGKRDILVRYYISCLYQLTKPKHTEWRWWRDQKFSFHPCRYIRETIWDFMFGKDPHWWGSPNYLYRADTNWLLEHDPGDTLQQGGCGQGAVIGPVIQRAWQESLGIKVGKSSLCSLQQKESAESCFIFKPITLSSVTLEHLVKPWSWYPPVHPAPSGVWGWQLRSRVEQRSSRSRVSWFKSVSKSVCLYFVGGVPTLHM